MGIRISLRRVDHVTGWGEEGKGEKKLVCVLNEIGSLAVQVPIQSPSLRLTCPLCEVACRTVDLAWFFFLRRGCCSLDLSFNYRVIGGGKNIGEGGGLLDHLFLLSL